MRKVIFLDRDGTLVAEPEDQNIDSLEKLRIFPETIPALQQVMKTDYKLIIVTNQTEMGYGKLSLVKFHEINNYFLDILKKKNIAILDCFFCPHKPADNCTCRKPKTGMIDEVKKKYNIDVKHSWIIGDRETDILLGKKVGLRTIHVKTGIDMALAIKPDYEADNMVEAVEFIIQ